MITGNMHQLTWATNSCGNGTGLDVDAGEKEVLGGVRVSGARQFEDAEVPVGTVRRGRGRLRRNHLLQRSGALRVPEADGAFAEVLYDTRERRGLVSPYSLVENCYGRGVYCVEYVVDYGDEL